MCDTLAGRFLWELYHLEVTQPQRRVIVQSVEFKEDHVLLSARHGTWRVDPSSTRWQIFDAMSSTVSDLLPPAEEPDPLIREKDIQSLWVEAHYDLAGDFGLVTTGAPVLRYTSVHLHEDIVTIAAQGDGVEKSLRLQLRPGELSRALSMDMARLFH